MAWAELEALAGLEQLISDLRESEMVRNGGGWAVLIKNGDRTFHVLDGKILIRLDRSVVDLPRYKRRTDLPSLRGMFDSKGRKLGLFLHADKSSGPVKVEFANLQYRTF